MKLQMTALVAVLAAASASFGAWSISLPAVTYVTNPGEIARLPVTASATAGLSGVTVYAGWYENAMLDFQYNPGFWGALGVIPPDFPPVSYDNGAGTIERGPFTHDVAFGGTSHSGIVFGDIVIGQLLVPTAGLAPGDYKVHIDGTNSVVMTTGGGAFSDVFGVITVTPEPATIAMLALGGLLLGRRRRA